MVQRTEEFSPLRVRDLHRGGVYKDVRASATELPIFGFQNCKNTRFRQGVLEVVPGWNTFGSPALDSRAMYGTQYLKRDGTDHLLAASLSSLWRYDPNAGTWGQITPGSFSSGADDFFDSATAFDTFVITNNKDVPQKWTGTGAVTALGGLNALEGQAGSLTQAKIVRSFNGFVFLLSTTENGVVIPQRVRWGRQNALENFQNDVNGNGQAGFYDLVDDPDFIQDAVPLSSSFLVMKERSFWTLQYVGLPTIWVFRKVVSGLGLLAQRAWVNMGDEIVFLGQDNFYVFGGYRPQEVGDNRIKNFFFADVNPRYANRIQAFLIREDDEIRWTYCSLRQENGEGEADTAVVWNYNTKTWSIRQDPAVHWFQYIQYSAFTWDTMPDLSWDDTPGAWGDRRLISQFPLNLFGLPDGTIQRLGGVYSLRGLAYVKNAETKLHDMGKPEINKRVERVEVAVDRTIAGTLNVYVGHCKAAGDTITYEGPFTIDMTPGKPRYFTCDITDLWFDLKFETTGMNDPWKVLEYVIWYREKSQQ